MTGKEQRILGWVIDDLAAGSIECGVRRLCQLVRREVPELHAKPVRKPTRASRQGPQVFTGSLPAKRKRVVNKVVLADYGRTHDRCEVAGLDCRYVSNRAQVHHLIRRSQGGADDEHNLLALCVAHHTGLSTGFHALPVQEWFDRYKDRMLPAARAKVAAALRLKDDGDSPVRVPGSHALQRS